MTAIFVTVAYANEIDNNTAIQVWVDDEPIAVFNLNGDFYAISDICTHEECFLHDGLIEDGEIECPRHLGIFDIRTGSAEVFPAEKDLRTFPCRVIDGKVQVCITSS